MSEPTHEGVAAIRNRLFPPITDLDYGLARALESYIYSYDYIVSQPSVLGPEASQRFREIAEGPGTSLPEDPLPLDEFDV